MLKNLYTKLTGDSNAKEIQRVAPIVDEINALEPELQALSDAQLRAKTAEFRARLADALDEPRANVAELQKEFDNAADAEDRRIVEEQLKQAKKDLVAAERAAIAAILPEAFACVREASERTIGLRHYDVQMIGGIVLHEGKVAEMRTGEGKTLVATLPLYLNALLGRGAHLVTVNDYLARRDAQWMGPIYHLLGLTVGILQQGEHNALKFDPDFKAPTPDLNHLRAVHKQEAYACDITYGTNNEFGFDYLRDNMAWRLEDRVQRELYYAIVDEVDNILIDEARTPLIISGPAGDASEEYYRLADVVRKLSKDDYAIEERTRSITLTEAGYDRVEELLGTRLTNPDHAEESDYQQAKIMHHLEAALKAEYLFKRDKDYIVRKGQVIIVDEFTGRLMPGRRWSDGLHQAVEAKEKAPIQPESVTYATVTLQNYFRLYARLAGMTGTAKTEEDEFQKVYGLDVVVIPTNKPMIRGDHPDLIYRNEESKWRAATVELVDLYARGQPTLVGTTSIEASERLSKRMAAPKLQLLARVRLLYGAVDVTKACSDKQRETLKLVLGRSLDDAPENYEEALAARLFHDYDLRVVGEATRKIGKNARELLRLRARVGARSEKELAAAKKQFNLGERELREIGELEERDLKFAAHLEERGIRLDAAETLCAEIAARPDDLHKTAQKFGMAAELALDVYQHLRLSRDELLLINRELIDVLGNFSAAGKYRIRGADMDVILRRLFLREDDLARLAKKLDVNADPFAAENVDALREIFGVEDYAALQRILREGIPHAVLNAKEHEREAHVIARAGEPYAITLATNMAGRGVDIKLGGELPEETLNELGRILRRNEIDPYNMSYDQMGEALAKIPAESYELDKEHAERFQKYMRDRARVRELGGLRIIGTERHEARRIDNQLRGRSGRQGDAGSSRFYVSIEDEIMRRMGGKGMMDKVWIEDIPIEHEWVSKALEQSQVKMEGYNFDIRKHLLQYDDVLNQQREIIYGQRYRILTKADLRDDLRGWAETEIALIVEENLKTPDEHAGSRLLLALDAALPNFYLNENELYPAYSLELVLRALGETRDPRALLDAARRAMQAHRDFIVQVIVPEAVNLFQAQSKATWDEIEDLAKNTFTTTLQEAQEQNRRVDTATLVQTVSRAVGLNISVRGAPNAPATEKDVLGLVRQGHDLRVVDQVARRISKRANIEFQINWDVNAPLDFDVLLETLTTAIEKAYAAQADKTLEEIERDLSERAKPEELQTRTRRAHTLYSISHARKAVFDQRTHRKLEMWTPRFPWVHLAAEQIARVDKDTLKEELAAYWNQSLEALEQARGGAETFSDLIRELMLSVVTSQWVDYLTEIEDLRTGIGLQAFGQRDPLVEYKRRAYGMFQDLTQRIRAQVVGYVFSYQYRGLAKHETASRERAVQSPALPVAQPLAARVAPVAAPRAQVSQPAASARAAVAARPTNIGSIGRNDPCWCGSGKKYKHCHMESDGR